MKKYISAVMTVLMLLSFLAACGGGGSAPSGNDAAQTDTGTGAAAEASQAAETRAALDLPASDFKGAKLRILEYARSNMFRYFDFEWSSDYEGDLVNEAVMKRNTMIEDRYNCSVTAENKDSIEKITKSNILAGTDDYDVYEPQISHAVSMSADSLFYDFYKMPHMALDKDWWDTVIQRDLALNHKIYVMTGDISIFDEEHNYAIYFNKDVAKNSGIESPYERVRQNKWTWDEMMKDSSVVSRDLNGDGVRDEHDFFGILTSDTQLGVLYYSAGQSITRLDENGKPYFTCGTERSFEVLDGLTKYLSDSDLILWASKCSKTWTTLNEILQEDRCLYRIGSVYNISGYREMKSDFGVLPYPKYDDRQEYYAHIISQYCPVLTIPVTNKNLDFTGFLLEALAYESRETVTVAYYDVNLYTKMSRDNESGEMLDIIFATRMYDIGRLFSWGKVDSKITNLIASGQPFPSQWASVREQAEAEMAKTMEYFDKDQ